MNMHDLAVGFMHGFWPAFFIAFGLHLMWRRRYLSVRDTVRYSSLCSPSKIDEALQGAIARRDAAEGVAPPIGVYGGAISVGLGIVAIFNMVPAALLYGVLCFALSALIGAAFLRLRNSQRLRTAVLAPRTSGSVIPAYWFVVAAVAGLSMLTFVTVPHLSVAAILVACSSLGSTYLAWRLTQLPAILSGVDVEAEQRVDDKLRFARSASAMMFALVQCFVFSAQVVNLQNDLQIAAYVLNFPTWIGFAIWMRIPDPAPSPAKAR